MQKLLSLALGTISSLTQPSYSFQSHFKKTQAVVKQRASVDAHQDEPQLVDWDAASLEVLQSATEFCADGECEAKNAARRKKRSVVTPPRQNPSPDDPRPQRRRDGPDVF